MAASQEQLSILNQLWTLQAVIQSLPGQRAIAQALPRALGRIPGTTGVFACFGELGPPHPEIAVECHSCEACRSYALEARCPLQGRAGWEIIPLDGYDHHYGWLLFDVDDAAAFSIYRPHLLNLAGTTAMVLENLRRRELLEESNEKLHREMEQRVRAEDGLRKERDFADKLIDTAQAIILVLDTAGCIVRYNAYLENLSGYPLDEMKGKNWMESFIPEHERQRLQKIFETASAGVSTQGNINAILTRTGEERLVEWFDHVLTDSAGKAVGLLAVGHDITEKKQAEDALIRYRDHLEELVAERTRELELARQAAEAANHAKSVFLANISHELRTPLNAILGFSRLLQKNSNLTDEQNREVDIINRSGSRLLGVINDVLEMARIEAGGVRLDESAFDLCELVQEVVDLMQVRAAEKGLQLSLDDALSCPRHIRGDAPRLRQILLNLVDNAVKFTVRGGVTLRLEANPDRPGNLLIEVEDTGPGIAPEDQSRIFEPFVQLGEDSLNRGSGLGLTIVRQFVQTMGGTVALESVPGQGSLFRVELPLREAGEGDVVRKLEKQAVVVGLAPGQPEYRILIVEDHPENRLLLARLMSDLGIAHKEAENGVQAIALFRDWHPQLILMDRRMPLMDGIEATRTIRGLPGGKEVKIVAVTSSAFKDERRQMLEAGMDDVVGKPFRFDEIYDCLARQLGVKFVYEGMTEPEILPAMLTPAMLTLLPGPLRAELKAALESLMEERIREVIGKVAAIDRKLEIILSRLAANYDYPSILEALKTLE